MKLTLGNLLSKTYKPLLERYLNKTRTWAYQGIKIKVLPGVFHPRFFFSTKILLHFLEGIDLHDRKLLELGAGSGLISIWSYARKALVTASDISDAAIKNIQINAEINGCRLTTIKSDLFDRIPEQQFDYIIVNPPFYPSRPVTDREFAWYAGPSFDYFEKFFSQLLVYINENSKIYMILSSNCDLQTIRAIADRNSFRMETALERKNLLETNFIFSILKK